MSAGYRQRKSANALPFNRTIKVLMYHHVLRYPCKCGHPWHCVHEDQFRLHLTWLDRWGYTAITFEDYRLFLEGKLILPKKPVIITFDDGYDDVYHVAFPLLQKFGMKAVIFVLADRKLTSSDWDKGEKELAGALMDEKQILEMHAAGFEVGSHSVSHAKLTAVPPETAWDEISRSRILLEIFLNAPVHSFAYPFGLLNERIKQMVGDAGYRNACSVYSGSLTFGADPFEIRRMTVPNSATIAGFAMRMLAPYELLTDVKSKIIRAWKGFPNFPEGNAGARQKISKGVHHDPKH